MLFYYNQLEKIKDAINKYKNKNVYLYPAGYKTNLILNVLENESDINIAGILDIKEKDIKGYKTIHPKQLFKEELSDSEIESVIFITSYQHELKLEKYLRDIGYSGIIDTLFVDDFANENNISKNDKDLLHIKRMDLVLTTKCSLKCEKCANLMQYYINPYDVDLDKIINTMSKLASIVDSIGTVYVLGGEPFLYRNLDKVVELLKRLNNVNRVMVVTNGTICPDLNSPIWKSLSDGKVCVSISDYGKISRNKEKLIGYCKKNLINCHLKDEDFFYDTGDMKKRNRSEEELNQVFLNCKTECRSLFNGELHYCPRSSHGVDLGFIPKRNEDYVDIEKENNKELRSKIEYLINKKTYIEACDYCNIRVGDYYEKKYPAAEQVKYVMSQY